MVEYKNPNRLILNLIKSRLKAMREELYGYISTIKDMVWEDSNKYSLYYNVVLESLHEIISAINGTLQALDDLLIVETRLIKVREVNK